MRELYACQLDLRESDGAVPVLELVQEWVSRGSETQIDVIHALSSAPLVTDNGHELYVALEQEARADNREWTLSWRRPDDHEAGLRWRILIATGPSPANTEAIRFTLRIRLERDGDRFQLAPLGHSFNSPTIVRTLLREHQAVDGSVRLRPTYAERRASDISALVARLEDPTRQLPVSVVTRAPGPEHSVDAGMLARSVAGLAHVEVLSTHLAALALTDELGREASVWGGGVRLYWPRFSREDDPFRHRLWTRRQVESTRDFPALLLATLGSLAAARVPEHPVVAKARRRRRPEEVDEETLPASVQEWVDLLEVSEAEAVASAKDAQAALAEALTEKSKLEAELASVRDAFGQFQAAVEDESSEPEADLDELTVAEAFRLAVEEAGSHVRYLASATDSIEEFASYKLPRRLYEALTTVSEAADSWQAGTLGPGFGQYFADRGFEFSQSNPAAHDRRTRAHYQVAYNGERVSMEPHLKVDQVTSPDQCLRVYWYRDDNAGLLVIGHVGRHLPD